MVTISNRNLLMRQIKQLLHDVGIWPESVGIGYDVVDDCVVITWTHSDGTVARHKCSIPSDWSPNAQDQELHLLRTKILMTL